MNIRTLGDSEIKVSGMGLGCWAIGGLYYHLDGDVIGYGYVKDEESIKAIQKALDLGITLFDTSDVYGCGHSEQVLGQALKGKREEDIIATKFGNTWKSEDS